MTTLTRPDAAPVEAGPAFSFLWLEITGRCGRVGMRAGLRAGLRQ